MLNSFDFGALLLLLAALIGILNERFFGLPRSIALLIGSLVVSLAIVAADRLIGDSELLQLSRLRLERADLPAVLLDGILALLLFAGSMHVDLSELRDRAWTILVLATGSVVLAAALFGAGFWALALMVGSPVPIAWCLVLGAVLAPTDAVVVEGLLRRIRLPAPLRAVIAGESLFNDGAAVVMFIAAIAFAQGQTDVFGYGRLTRAILIEGLGGAIAGIACGLVGSWLARRTEDRNLRIITSLALALSAYRLAIALGISGPIAVVAAGLAFRHWLHPRAAAPPDQGETAGAWELLDDVLNTFLFLFMGLQLLAVDVEWTDLALVLLSFALALIVRVLSICVPMLPLHMSTRDRTRGLAVLTWTGLRGGISIALALTLPDMPYRQLLLTVAYGVVVLTILLQGLLAPRVLAKLYGQRAEIRLNS